MKELLAELESGSKLTFANAANKDQIKKIAEYYIETYYSSLKYISVDYDYAMDLMEIFTDAYNNYALAKDEADESYMSTFVISVENLETILAAAEKALTAEFEMNNAEKEAYDELKAEFEAAKAEFRK